MPHDHDPHDHDLQDGNHMTKTGQQLADIVDLAALLPALLTSRTAPASGSGRTPGGSVAHSPSPVRLDILQALDGRLRDLGDDAEDRAWHDRMAGDHRQGLLPDLYQWAKLVEAEMYDTSPQLPAELPETPTLTSVVAWLQQHLDWALTQPWAVELVRDIDWWWRRVRHLVGERDPYQPRCPRCMFPIVEAGGGWWACQGCGAETSIETGLRRIAEPLITLSQAASITGVPLSTLKDRAQKGHLIPVTATGHRPSMYRLRTAKKMDETRPQ